LLKVGLPAKQLKDSAARRKDLLKAYDKAVKDRNILRKLPEWHEEVFSEVDCLECAGCCKNISPRFKKPDLQRIARHLGLKESLLIERYLRLDEDGDYVVQKSPCPFLGEGNKCDVYEVRPGDCRKYPHTDSGDFFKYPRTAKLNLDICPAVFKIMERIQKEIGRG
jgi:Fe-S-cluster containining protein